ncbi:MAG: hypothetical protein Q4B50_07285, partial [Bacillota bacterium]|nr:hypothetical protein [Bacillota bacterium]
MKKSLLFLLVCLTLVFSTVPALAASSKSDATLAEILVNEEEISIRNNMSSSIPIYAEEIELSFSPSYSKADMEL